MVSYHGKNTILQKYLRRKTRNEPQEKESNHATVKSKSIITGVCSNPNFFDRRFVSDDKGHRTDVAMVLKVVSSICQGHYSLDGF